MYIIVPVQPENGHTQDGDKSQERNFAFQGILLCT